MSNMFYIEIEDNGCRKYFINSYHELSEIYDSDTNKLMKIKEHALLFSSQEEASGFIRAIVAPGTMSIIDTLCTTEVREIKM